MGDSEQKCLKCGDCCKVGRYPKDFGINFNAWLPLTDEDCKRISHYLGISVSDFRKEYRVKGNGSMDQVGGCPFLDDDNSCKIHEVKPVYCSMAKCYYGKWK